MESPAPERGPAVPPHEDSTWARSVRRRLAVDLREVGHPEPGHVEALVAELLAVLGAVLRRSSRGAWLRMMEALHLVAPFRALLSGRPELTPFLEGLFFQFQCSRAMVSDLDVLGAVARAFPQDCALLWAPPRAAYPRDPDDPATVLPPAQEPLFAGMPCPFAAKWDMAPDNREVDPVSLQELQRSLGPVGSQVVQKEAAPGSLGIMALALATDVPTQFLEEPSSTAEPSVWFGQEVPGAAPMPQKEEKKEEEKMAGAGASPGKGPPMTGLQAAELFATNRHAGRIGFLYLNVAPNRHFRPYDLVAVPKHLTHPHHYVFSPFGVLHVRPREGSEACSLGEWHREAVLWQLLQYIPFFRLYLVRKAFACWCCNVKHLQRLKRTQKLRLHLLQAVPHFGAALLQISRLLQELCSAHWLPINDVRCYSFPELQNALVQERSLTEGLLRRFLLLCSSILELVRDDTYKMVHGMQTRVENYKLYITRESLYKQRMQFEGLQSRLREAESWLQRLGLLALLANFLICQTLVSAIQEDTVAFVGRTMKAKNAARKAVLHVSLVFGEDSQLGLFPSSQELSDCLLGAVEAVLESVLQMTRINVEEPPTEEGPKAKESKEEFHSVQPSAISVIGRSLSTLKGSPSDLAAELERLEPLPTPILCGEEPQLVHRLDLKAFGGLEVVGHRLRSEYPLLSREQLEQDLRSDGVIQEALATQQDLLKAALGETQMLCQEYAWLGEIYLFVHSWGPDHLESMKGWPAEEYVNRVVKLRSWVARVQNVPHEVVTYNRLLLVDCCGIHQDILPLLDSINKDILSLLLSETTQRSEVFIAELTAVLQLYMTMGNNDILTIAKCSQKLEEYQGQMKELQAYVDYVRALNEVIQHCFRPLNSREESLENMLMDTWDAFVFQQREVSDFIVSRRLSIIAELNSSLLKALGELHEMLAMVTVGRFLDSAQNPRAMEEELQALLRHFQSTMLQVEDLRRSQRILTGDAMDVSFIAGKQSVIEIQARIWQLYRIISEQITEWKCLAFAKFSPSLAMEKTEEWQKEVISIERCLPSNHPVLQACLRKIANFQKYLPLLLKLGSHFLKLSCWKEIFAVMGVKCPLNMQFTLGQLLSYPLLEYSDAIFRVYAWEKSRHYARDNLYRLQRIWTEKQFRLVNFILNVPYQEQQPERFRRPISGRTHANKVEYISKDSGTYVLSDIAELKTSLQNSLLTLQNIILSPFSSELLEEAESWAATLRTFDSLLEAWVSFQQKWVFLNIVLYEMNISLPSAELDSKFQRVDALFREVMQVTCNDPLVLSCVRVALGKCRDSRFVGSCLQSAFVEGSADLLLIIQALDYVLEATRMGFPRLFFLSNEEVVAMMATASEPADASAWAQRCFPGVRQLVLNVPSVIQDRSTFSVEPPVVEVKGLEGDHKEKLKLCHLVPISRKATQWLCALEQRMKETVFYQIQECVAQRLALHSQLDLPFERRPGPMELPLHLLAENWATLGRTFPSQCVLLAEEALWRVAAEEALVDPDRKPVLQLKMILKLEALTHYVRNYRSSHGWNPHEDQLGMLLGALITLTIHQRDLFSQLLECSVSSPQAFEWARQFKYHVVLHRDKAHVAGLPSSSPWVGSPPGCWAEVLDSQFQYGYEFLGPSLRLLGSPSLSRTLLGLLLALDEFRCGGLLGAPDTGKSHTMQGLAQALGRHLVLLSCSVQMSISCLSRYLCGAVHAGALLVLEAAEQLETAVLSAFTQRLVDLQRMCLSLQTSRAPNPASPPAGASTGSPDLDTSESYEEPPAIGLPELGTDEAEPYQPGVLGNILFGGRLLRVRETYGCVATLEHLPEALHLAVRPVALFPPDLTRLAEVTLLAAGFREATRLAEKLTAFLRMGGELGPGTPRSCPTLLREVIGMTINILFAPQSGQTLSRVRSKHSARTTFFLGLDEEPAMVKALYLSPLLNSPECPRLQIARELLHEIFPSASLQPQEAQMPARLQSALMAQLHEDRLHPDPRFVGFASLVFQALQGTAGVVLLGPSGGGKSTVWRALAKAQSRLAASDATHGGPPAANAQPEKRFQPVSTVCLWPNGLSVVELMGSLEGSLWQDGVLSRLLQRAATSALAGGTDTDGTQQWLVLDGAACPEWLEPISSIFSARPSLTLPNGQHLQAPENVKFLFEMPDASGVPPSVCAHCTLLHCAATSVWRAMLSSALTPAYRKYSLTQEDLALLRELAEELFPPTLAFAREHYCSVLLPHSHPQNPVAEGIQETTTFTRILHALLQQYVRRDTAKPLPAPTSLPTESKAGLHVDRMASASLSMQDSIADHHRLLVQSIFVFAYIWGFGSHLHSRHWPCFDRFVRRTLLSSNCLIELPPADSVFDLCPVVESGRLEPFKGSFLSQRVKVNPGSFSVLPQYERVLFVVDLLLSADHPVLLVGEPGSGKSSFAEMLVQPNYLYHRVCLTPALSASHLRHLMLRRFLSTAREKGLFPGGKQARGMAAKAGSLFLVEDLHMAFVDPTRGSSPVAETLRQALTQQQFYHAETLELQQCPATSFNCFGTLSVPMTGARPICPRFGRLFSTVGLPPVTRDSLFCMYTGTVFTWLEKFPMLTRHGDLASSIVRATVEAYEAARKQFQPSPACCLFQFSLHAIQKVIKGMLLLRPRPGIHLSSPLDDSSSKAVVSRRTSGMSRLHTGPGYTTVLTVRLIVRLWIHESLRVFSDPLRGKHQRELCGHMLGEIAMANFCAKRQVGCMVPSSVTQASHLPSRGNVTFQLSSISGVCVTEDEMPDKEDLLLSAHFEQGFCCTDKWDYSDPWDPVEQAPPLALDRPAPAPKTDPSPMPVLECESAEVETEDPEAGKKWETGSEASTPEPPRVGEPHASPRRPSSVRVKHRSLTSRKEISGPLLPSHLLLLQGESVRDIVFSKDLGTDAYSPTAHNPYQEKLWKALESQLAPSIPPDFLLCTEGLRHIVRLSRLLCGPDRHAALVSFSRCTGRQTLVTLVARATDSLVMELPAKADEAETLGFMRLATWKAAVKGARVLLLVHPGMRLASLHLVLALMAEGTCPGLYGPDDAVSIIPAMLHENPAIKRTMRDEIILQKFFQFVRSNLHVLLLLGGPRPIALPPLTAVALGQLLCCLEVYQPWSQASLEEVASKHFKKHLKQPMRLTRELPSLNAHKDLLRRLTKAAARFHSSAVAHAAFLNTHLPLVSPKSLLDFLDTFIVLLDSMQEKCSKQMERVKMALVKMGEVSKRQQEHTRDAQFLQQKLVKIKEQMVQSQREIEREKEVLRQQEKECREYEARIEALTQEREVLEKEKEMAMKKVRQDYQTAVAMLHLHDVEELRSYRQPPATVVRVTDILCLMFQQEPGWESAKMLLNREDFYQDLVFYPKENFSTELFRALGQALAVENFTVDFLKNISQAVAALWQWISAIYRYHSALRNWQPAMMQLERCDVQLNTEKNQLGDRRLHAEQLKEATEARIQELKEKQERQEKLVQQLTQSLQAKEEASTVENSVAEHLANWTTLIKSLEHHRSTMYGNTLLCAATVSYLGPFPPSRREELLEKWQALLAGCEVPLEPDDIRRTLQEGLPCPGPAPLGPPLLEAQRPLDLLSLLSSPGEQRIWDRLRKPKDPESRLMATILLSSLHAQAHRWPLLVDPNGQALVWLLSTPSLEHQESQAYILAELVPEMAEQGGWDEIPENNLEILSLTDPDLEHTLRKAISHNSPVLLMNFEKNVPWCPTLRQLMQKKSFWGTEGLVLPAKAAELQQEKEEQEEEEVKVLPSFQLYLCTELPFESLAAEVDQMVLKSLNMIDLSLSPKALEDMLLSEVLKAERRETLKNRQALHLALLHLESKLEATEEELLELISQPQRSLLEEENFMPMVRLLQTQIQALQATHQHMAAQHRDQVAICDNYRRVARVAVTLHKVLQQVAHLHPFYRFPSEACVEWVRQALATSKRQQDANKQETLEARLLELSKAVLRQLLTEVLPSLREIDRPLYCFLGALVTLQGASPGAPALSPVEWLAFCGGLREPAAKALLLLPEEERGAPPAPHWVAPGPWEECRALEQLPGFQGLQASLAEQGTQWQEYLRLPSTVVGPALCPSHAHLGPFQRAILWRVLRPSAMSQVMAHLATCLLGWSRTDEAETANPHACSRPNRPIIFLTPPSDSDGSFTLPLLWIQQMAAQRKRAGKVVVLTFGTPDAPRRVWRALPACTKKGKWLVLSNCHLQAHWDPDVLLQLDQLLNAPMGAAQHQTLEVHAKFRLWLITAANAPESVPGPVHRKAAVFFCEEPLEFRGILMRTHQKLQGQVHGLDTRRTLAFLILHAILVFRQNYSRWTQATLYLWNHGEVTQGLHMKERLSRLHDRRPKALMELAGTMLYGGHVLDSGDAQAIESLCRQCLSSSARLQPGSGPQRILDLVIGHPTPGLSEEEASAATQARIAQLPSPMEASWVGLCSGLREEMQAAQSQVLLSALWASQGLWQPRAPLLQRRQQEQQEALERLVREGLALVEELQGQLERCGWEAGDHGCPPQGQPRPRHRPLQRFLLEEGGTLLALLTQVGRDLRCVEGHLQGAPCSSTRCSAILQELLRGQMPGPWLPFAPTGPQPPQLWLETLRLRCQLLCRYLACIGGHPVTHFQLAAFHRPRHLFLALLQERARTEKQPVDCYQLEQKVLPGVLPPSEAPERGIYLSGLEVHHAMWHSYDGQLQETLSNQPCRLPTVWVQPIRRPWKRTSSQTTYLCPVYLGLPGMPVTLDNRQVLMHLPLPTTMAPELCAQRRVFAVSLLQ
ncbi:dynein heavy chain domain-containing protein 1 isoform X1 [Anolis carolinensis]|uniref:dynein heavy chain domain-containing protein 1 isoform X1 n=2 Tax=Anolis carolinensis TaxID=28377 RepID=UPI002F2B5D1A